MRIAFLFALLAGLLMAQTGSITVTPPSGAKGGVIKANAGRVQMTFTAMGNPATGLTINLNLAPPCPEVKPPAPVTTAAQTTTTRPGDKAKGNRPTLQNMVHEYNMYFTNDQVYVTGQNCGPDSVTATFRRVHTGAGIAYDVAATPGGGMTAHSAGSL